jgi:hypothetical protein
MVNLWSTNYGIGVQSSTTYFRSDSRFSWHRGGSHNDAENNAGGGVVAMTLDSSSNLTVAGGLTTVGSAGIGTSTPQYRLDVNSSAANNFAASFGTTVSVGQWSGIHFGYSESANQLYRKSAIVFERTDNGGGGGNAAGRVHILNGPATTAGSATLADARLTINETGSIIQSAGLYYNPISGSVSAAGTTQGTATLLTTTINNITTVAASSGVVLPTPVQAGARMLIRNGGTNILRVYPQTSAQINTLGANVALQLEQGALIEFVAFTTTQWYTVNATFA